MSWSDMFDMSTGFLHWFLGESQSNKALQEYAAKLQTICDLMKTSHIVVISLLEELLLARTEIDAKRMGMRLRDVAIAGIFRNQELCDKFEESGKILREIVKEEQKTLQNEARKLAAKAGWMFSSILANREKAVARLYHDETIEIQRLANSPSTSWNELKQAAREAESKLISQLADFDSLANQFQQQVRDNKV